jgi:hypothetical protein
MGAEVEFQALAISSQPSEKGPELRLYKQAEPIYILRSWLK